MRAAGGIPGEAQGLGVYPWAQGWALGPDRQGALEAGRHAPPAPQQGSLSRPAEPSLYIPPK